MIQQKDDVDHLLKARAEIDEQLRRHKSTLTVLFTDVVGSTGFFERNGDTAGLAMIHRHDKLASDAVQMHGGRVVKTIGDSAMAEFADPSDAVRAAVEIERQFFKLNQTLTENQRVEIRIGIHSGVGYRKGNDLFGDVVNVAARIVKRTAAAQILVSRPVYEAISEEPDLRCQWLSKVTMDGRIEKEDIYEVAWTDAEAYREVRERPAGTTGIPPRFEVLSQVGAGGVGVVYKVRDVETDEIVALKILKPEFASDPTGQENFKRELMLSRKITHKNVCRIYDFGRSNGVSYASMELVEGESLLTRLGRVGPMPVGQAIEIVQQICAGLREAHAQGIVHRDLKPANIMLDRSGTVKIMDFGVARLIQGDGPMTGTIVGTPAYMAPEQAELKPVSACTDIYALGLVFYEMVTGVPAFTGDSPVAVALKQIRDYPKRPREIVALLSPPIEAVIMKCIQKDAAKRFRSVDELEAALNKASKARPIAAWQLSIDRTLRKTEQNVSDVLEDCVEIAREYLKRQDWRGIVKDPKRIAAALVIPGLLCGVITFAMLRGGKSHPNYVQTVQLGSASQKSSSAVAEAQREIAPRINSENLMVTNEVDLNRDAKSAILKAESPTEVSLKSDDQGTAPELLSTGHTQSTPAKKHEKAAAPADAQKAQSKQQVQARSQTPANPAQTPVLTSVDTIQPAATDEAANVPQQKAAIPELMVAEASPAGEKKPASTDAKTPSTYFEVGSFKDESWADAAVEKLTQLGFHAVLMHKNLLWTQSYHVQVGPYDDPKEIEAARQTLASQGFKPHAVK